MLEHSTLLIHGWTRTAQASSAPEWTRRIADAAGRSLGFVRHQQLAANSWFFWLRKVRLDVFETEDASHLMSLTRSWTMRQVWDLHDAEEHHVGYVYPRSLASCEGGMLGFVDSEPSGSGRILDHAGAALATFTRKSGDVLEVTFASGSGDNPFLRMLLLGWVLTRDSQPKGT